MTGVDSWDGWDRVIVFGPDHRPWSHHPPVPPLIGDNEYCLIRRQSLRRPPGMQEVALESWESWLPLCYNSRKHMLLSFGSLFSSVRGYTLITSLLAQY
jgi:hypothetical protein